MSHVWETYYCHVSSYEWHSILVYLSVWVMSHIWMRHVTHMNDRTQHMKDNVYERIWVTLHMNESCHTYECVTSHIWMSHVTHMHESRHTYAWVTSHICMSHVTHMHDMALRELNLTYEWVVSHMNESCHIWMSRVTYEWVVSHINKAYHPWMTRHSTWEKRYMGWLRLVSSLIL